MSGRLTFVSPAAPALHLLDDVDREDLRRIVDESGLYGAAKLLNLSRGVVSSAVGGIGVRKGSVELVRAALAAWRQSRVNK